MRLLRSSVQSKKLLLKARPPTSWFLRMWAPCPSSEPWAMGDILEQLIDLAPTIPASRQGALTYRQIPMAGTWSDPTSSAGFYPRLQRMLKSGDILAIEAGSCELPLLGMRLPEGVRSQPRCFGAPLAGPVQLPWAWRSLSQVAKWSW
jgi:hypothetical protein